MCAVPAFNLLPVTQTGCALRADSAPDTGHLPKYSFTIWVTLVYFKKWKLESIYCLSQKLQKRTYRATLIENALEGKGRRRRGVGRGEKMGWGKQGSVIILLTVIKREMKGIGKKK